MKCRSMRPMLLLSLLAGAHGHSLSPITRVVELLSGLAEKVEAELKTEETLYEKYVCWATSVINAKTQSNVEANQRITTLQAYVEDLDSNRVELTSERQDLTTEVQGLNTDIETANAKRSQEHEDYLMAKDEMEKAISALQHSIDVLEDATRDHQDGVFMAMRHSPARSFKRQAEGRGVEGIAMAIQLANQALVAEDARFLEGLLTGDVPTWDWEKLNRDATFKMKYKARSGKILEVLRELQMTFESNLQQAEAKETQASNEHSQLSGAKGQQLESTEQSLSKLEVEGEARAASKMTSEEELRQLQAQVSADKGFISETQGALKDKKAEWKTRKDLRHAEIEALTKAIAILRSDDARDLFKRSFASQGFSFLSFRSGRAAKTNSLISATQANMAKELSSVSSAAVRSSLASRALREAAAKASDGRLRALAGVVAAASATSVASGRSEAAGHFDAVIAAIDKMIEVLHREEATDLSAKEKCEEDRAQNARAAAVAARTIDEYTDTLARLASEIDSLKKNAAEAQEEVDTINEQVAAADRLRADEHSEWKKSDADDEEAAQVVQQAIDVLTTFYTENGLALIEQQRQNPDVIAGEAPPPPPQTWEGPYKGASGEKDGIISILTLIREDILKDQSKAKTTEAEADASYRKFVEDSDAQIRTLQSTISTIEGTISTKESEVGSTVDLRLTKKGSLDMVMKGMADVYAGCDFMTVNYPMRLQNRQIELDGLEKAKTILIGALPASAS